MVESIIVIKAGVQEFILKEISILDRVAVNSILTKTVTKLTSNGNSQIKSQSYF